jgi:UDP:flavonoid glycosyltransferase YjiC (YdhE family)
VAYGPDEQGQANATDDFYQFAQNGFSAISRVIERANRVWMEKSATLTSLAQGADLLLAHMNDQALAANVAEFHDIPLVALHVFPARIMPSGAVYSVITKGAQEAQRVALGLPVPATLSTRQTVDSGLLEIQSYDELCLPGPAAEWVQPGDLRPFVGVLTLELPTESDEEVLSWIAAGTPPIYFGFGSTPIVSPADTVAMISAVCAQLGERALICSGVSELIGAPPMEHVKVVGSLNYATVFPACRAVVHHGGSGTTAAGVRAGVPSLILWTVWDQPVWAAALEQLKVGTGRQLSASAEDTLAADLRSILTPECSARAREVAAQMTKVSESVSSAADLVEARAPRR